jgi:hypothetical protein
LLLVAARTGLRLSELTSLDRDAVPRWGTTLLLLSTVP